MLFGHSAKRQKKYAPSGRNHRGRTSLCAAWSIVLESCRSPQCVSCDPHCFGWFRFLANVIAREGYAERLLTTFAAPAGTVIQLFPTPSIGDGFSLRNRGHPKTTTGTVEALCSSHAPYVASNTSLGNGHIARGINFTPFAFPVVTEATELYCFSAPARQNQCTHRLS